MVFNKRLRDALPQMKMDLIVPGSNQQIRDGVWNRLAVTQKQRRKSASGRPLGHFCGFGELTNSLTYLVNYMII